MLGSTRDLNTGPEEDQQMALVLKAQGLPMTEMAMMEYLWQHSQKPDSLKTAISSSSGQRPDETRANTDDSLIDMVKNIDSVKGKNILFISNNPYICYQDAVAKSVLKPYDVTIETVGEAMHDDRMEIVLDTIARCLTNTKS